MGTRNEGPFSTSISDMGDAKPHLRPHDLASGVTVPESVTHGVALLELDDVVGDLSPRDCRRLQASSAQGEE